MNPEYRRTRNPTWPVLKLEVSNIKVADNLGTIFRQPSTNFVVKHFSNLKANNNCHRM